MWRLLTENTLVHECHSFHIFLLLQIYDGSTSMVDLLGTFCNLIRPQPPLKYISRSDVLYVRFRTDFWFSSSGFNILYNIVKGKEVELVGVGDTSYMSQHMSKGYSLRLANQK